MATAERTEFVFPDEAGEQENPRKGGRVVDVADTDEDTTPEIEVVDDTPPEDRNRQPLPEPPREPTDDELARYDVSVRSRIKQFTKGYHDERRAKEAALREREEAVRLAQQVMEENRHLRGSLGQSQVQLVESAKKSVAGEVEAAKAKLKAAHEAFDPEAIANAQEELMKATVKADRLQNFRPPASQERENAVQPTQNAPAPVQVDEKAAAWQASNTWFGRDPEMTSFALGYHTKLVQQGMDPKSDDYYKKLNTRLRQVFPDQFESDEHADAPTQRTKSNVAPAARSVAPRKITLTQTQVALAKRLGLPLEVYARQVAKEMTRSN